MYIHAHTYMYMVSNACPSMVRPMSALKVSLLRLLDANFPGNSLRAWRFHPWNLRLCLSQTL